MSDHITSTPLEREADALVACISAWAYPADVEVRCSAMAACGLLGVDYIETMAAIYERAREARPGVDIHPDNARYAVAMLFLDRLATLRSQGHQPRPGVLATGKQADSLGRDPASYPNIDDEGYAAP